jgi:CubicO group peptidase (beta-lactamase class C family)
MITTRKPGLVLFLALSLGCSGRQIRPNVALEPAQAPGFDAPALSTVLNNAQNGDANIHSLVIERRGRMIAEIYRPGSDKTMMKRYGMGNPFASDIAFDADTLHDVRSVSKSVTALLFGLVKYEKILPPPETSVLSVYPDLADLATEARGRITFAHLLTMTSGLNWREWGRGFLTSDETSLLWKDDPVRFMLDRDQAAEPGAKFNYGGGHTAVLADTLVKKTGRPLAELARTELFEPLGITRWEWATDSKDRPLAHAGLRLTPRDMAKIGRLVLNKGLWNGKRVLSQSWIESSTRAHITTGIDIFSASGQTLDYGYQWWVGKTVLPNRSITWSAAVGNGGQRIYVVPELDMVVVTTAGDYGSLPIHKTIAQIFDAIVAAAI